MRGDAAVYEIHEYRRRRVPTLGSRSRRLGNIDPTRFTRGKVSADSGRLTGDTLKVMIDLALAGKLDGICFAPLNKGALHQAAGNFTTSTRCSPS